MKKVWVRLGYNVYLLYLTIIHHLSTKHVMYKHAIKINEAFNNLNMVKQQKMPSKNLFIEILVTLIN